MSIDKIVRSIKGLSEKEQMAVFGFAKGLEVADKGEKSNDAENERHA